ncbi:MAG: Holliday junction branch migration protein RuvA [Planctomycetes bacterium]|nr:Holliday junction branch migration protein RuvA [Planctomycetota bacterium]
MYEHVRGRLDRKTPAEAVVEAGGVGFLFAIPLTTYESLPAEGTEVRLFAELVVREDSQRLFGFATREERVFFRTLQSVSGVGPSVAMQIVSSMPYADFREAVVSGDASRLRLVRGIGKKLSERLVLELRDKVESLPASAAGASIGDPVQRDALLALEALGFPRPAAERALAACREEGGPAAGDAGDLVRRALRHV